MFSKHKLLSYTIFMRRHAAFGHLAQTAHASRAYWRAVIELLIICVYLLSKGPASGGSFGVALFFPGKGEWEIRWYSPSTAGVSYMVPQWQRMLLRAFQGVKTLGCCHQKFSPRVPRGPMGMGAQCRWLTRC